MNQKCTNQPTLINLHPNEYIQGLHYYPFAINLDRYVESCNTLNDLSNKVCVPNKIEDLNLSIFIMISGINESETLTKHMSYECKCNFDGRNVIQVKIRKTVNVDVSLKIWKNIMFVKKIIFRILQHVVVKI